MLNRLLPGVLALAACAPVSETAGLAAEPGPESAAERGAPPEPRLPEPPPARDDAPVADDAGHEPESPATDAFSAEEELALERGLAHLDAKTRAAFKAFFATGPGRTEPDGTIDVQASSSSGYGGATLGRPYLRLGSPVPGFPGAWNLQISVPETGIVEKFVLQFPQGPVTTPRPLLVVFHKYGVSHADALYNTDFDTEALSRGWYMLAPLGAYQTHFGDALSQQNTLAAIEYARSVCNIDPTRIYGVGFSMGGGALTSFASRHLDPQGPMFAAVANHTGTVSLNHAYANEGSTVQALMVLRLGDPVTNAFQWKRLSSVDLVTVAMGDPLDPADVSVAAGTDVVRNLKHAGVQNLLADQDPMLYLALQTSELSAHVQTIHPSSVFTQLPGAQHSWDTLDESAVCNWFAQKTLALPTAGSALIDRNTYLYGPHGGTDLRYLHFRVQEDVDASTTQFVSFDWSANATTNELELLATSNVSRLSIDATDVGLAYAGSLTLEISSADASDDEIVLLDVPQAPVSVTRDVGPTPPATYDPVGQTLTIPEPGVSGVHVWTIAF